MRIAICILIFLAWTGAARAEERLCDASAAIGEARVTVGLIVDGQGQLVHTDASLDLARESEFGPSFTVLYDFPKLGDPALGSIVGSVLGFGVNLRQPPKARTAEVAMAVGDSEIRKSWDTFDAQMADPQDGYVSFFGIIDFTDGVDLLAKAEEEGRPIKTYAVADDGVLLMNSAFVLPRRQDVQAGVDEAFGKALQLARKPETNCEVVDNG